METGFLGVFRERRDSAETDKGIARAGVCVSMNTVCITGQHTQAWARACTDTHAQTHTHQEMEQK